MRELSWKMVRMARYGEENRSAFIAVDLVRDFVDLKFGSPEALKVAEKNLSLLKKIQGRMPIILTRDSHIKNDPEFRVWGEHCLEGTEGSELYGELGKIEGRIMPKRHYDAFFETDLDSYLRNEGINHLFISGISTDICVMHTVAGAFFRNYRVTVLEDLCCSMNPEKHQVALDIMKSIYGITITVSEKVGVLE